MKGTKRSEEETSKVMSEISNKSCCVEEEIGQHSSIGRAQNTGGDGLSAYERLRLERIRRNKAYLAELGLDNTNGGESLSSSLLVNPDGKSSKSEGKNKRKRRSVADIYSGMTKKSSSRERKSINYSEAAMEKRAHGEVESKKLTDNEKNDVTLKSPRKKKKKKDAVPLFIYQEFRRIEGEKKADLKVAEKHQKEVERELRYARQNLIMYNREQEKLEREKVRMQQKREKQKRKNESDRMKKILASVMQKKGDLLNMKQLADNEYWREIVSKKKEREKKLEDFEVFREKFDFYVNKMLNYLTGSSITEFKNKLKEWRNVKTIKDHECSHGTKLNENLTPLVPDIPVNKSSKVELQTTNTPISDTMVEDTMVEEPIVLKISINGDEKSPSILTPVETFKLNRSKYHVRKVGGPIPIEFANKINRDWLDADVTTSPSPTSIFVPQVGDTVLYFPFGHKVFLDAHPDHRAVQSRLKRRLPIWEKYSWGESFFSQSTAKEGILCKVLHVHTEFPVIPSKPKIGKQGNNKIKSELASSDLTSGTNTSYFPLAVSLVLKSLSKLSNLSETEVVSSRNNASSDVTQQQHTQIDKTTSSSDFKHKKVKEENNFSVLYFPSNTQTPFLVPFVWSYCHNRSLSVGDCVKFKKRTSSTIPSKETDWLEGHIESICEGKSESPLYQDTRSKRTIIPAQDFDLINKTCEKSDNTNVSLDTLSDRSTNHALDSNFDGNSNIKAVAELSKDPAFGDWPKWDGVTVAFGDKDEKREVSSWELIKIPSRNIQLKSSGRHPKGPSGPALLVNTLDDTLRQKLEEALRSFIQNNKSYHCFLKRVTKSQAPAYMTVVPLQIYLEKVLRRIRLSNDFISGGKSYYYRSVGSLLADLSEITNNCFLYNEPTSAIAAAAAKFGQEIKDLIINVERSVKCKKNLEKKAAKIKKNAEKKPAKEVSGRRRCRAIQWDWLEKDYPDCWVELHKRQDNLPQSYENNVVIHDNNIMKKAVFQSDNQSYKGNTFNNGSLISYQKNRKWVKTPNSQQCFMETHKLPDQRKYEQSTIISSQTFPYKHHAQISHFRNQTVHSSGEEKNVNNFDRFLANNYYDPNCSQRENNYTNLFSSGYTSCGSSQTPQKGNVEPDQKFPPKNPNSSNFKSFKNSHFSSGDQVYWIPQRGDQVLYNVSLHNDFVSFHRESLSYNQQKIPSFRVDVTKKWTVGTIQNVRIILPDLCDKIQSSFEDFCSILVLKIKFDCDPTKNHLIHWRPCRLSSSCIDTNGEKHAFSQKHFSSPMKCKCGLDLKKSFIFPVWRQLFEESLSQKYSKLPPYAPVGIDPLIRNRLLKIFSFFKDISGKGIDFIFDDFEKYLQDLKSFHYNTNDPADPGLVNKSTYEYRFLPIDHKKHNLFSPGLCLDLIFRRLQNNYYRQLEAVIDEIYQTFLVCALNIMGSRTDKILSAFKKDLSNVQCHAVSDLADTNIQNGSTCRQQSISSSKSKDGTLQEKDTELKSQVEDLSKLCSILLMSIEDTDHIQDFFCVRGMPSKKLYKPTFTPYEQKVVGELLQAVSKDPGKIHNFYGQHNQYPTIKVKIKPDFDSDSQTGNSDLPNVKEALSFFSQPILLEPNHYENNTALQKALFGVDKRRNPCVRCQAANRDMLVCRLKKGHFNPDFDLISFSNYGGVDQLLSSYDAYIQRSKSNSSFQALENRQNCIRVSPSSLSPTKTPTDHEQPQQDGPLGKEKIDDEKIPDTTEINSANSSEDKQTSPSVVNEKEETDEKNPKCIVSNLSGDGKSQERMLAMAEFAIILAKDAVQTARHKLQCPHLLSDSFIKENFPIDSSDGHYEFCVICGVSGEMICCEGCPNVAHSRCVKLNKIPDGDWFCPTCVKKGMISDEISKASEQISIVSESKISNYNQEKDSKKNNDEVGTNIIVKDSLENIEPNEESETNKKRTDVVGSESHHGPLQSSKTNYMCVYNQEKDRKENNDEVGTNITAKDSLENIEPDADSEINKKGNVAVDSETQRSKNNVKLEFPRKLEVEKGIKLSTGTKTEGNDASSNANKSSQQRLSETSSASSSNAVNHAKVIYNVEPWLQALTLHDILRELQASRAKMENKGSEPANQCTTSEKNIHNESDKDRAEKIIAEDPESRDCVGAESNMTCKYNSTKSSRLDKEVDGHSESIGVEAEILKGGEAKESRDANLCTVIDLSSKDSRSHISSQNIAEEGKMSQVLNVEDNVDSAQVVVKVGTKIMKSFQRHGDFMGIVKCIPTKKNLYYKVRYNDGDEEDMSDREVQINARRYIEKTAKVNLEKKRNRGRPRKSDNNVVVDVNTQLVSTTTRRKRGRPSSAENLVSTLPRRKRGRPPKAENSASTRTQRKRGRPSNAERKSESIS